MRSVMNALKRVWRCWRSMWEFRWDEVAGVDYHKWESRMEIRRRLSGPRRDCPNDSVHENPPGEGQCGDTFGFGEDAEA